MHELFVYANDFELLAKVRARIPRIRDIVDFRNALIHDYEEVDVDEVWEIAADIFPQFY